MICQIKDAVDRNDASSFLAGQTRFGSVALLLIFFRFFICFYSMV